MSEARERIESPHKYLGHDAYYWHEQMMIAAAKHLEGRCDNRRAGAASQPTATAEVNVSHELAVEILVAHQRINVGSCGCGWNRLGESFCEHQVEMLEQANLNPPAPVQVVPKTLELNPAKESRND